MFTTKKTWLGIMLFIVDKFSTLSSHNSILMIINLNYVLEINLFKINSVKVDEEQLILMSITYLDTVRFCKRFGGRGSSSPFC